MRREIGLAELLRLAACLPPIWKSPPFDGMGICMVGPSPVPPQGGE